MQRGHLRGPLLGWTGHKAAEGRSPIPRVHLPIRKTSPSVAGRPGRAPSPLHREKLRPREREGAPAQRPGLGPVRTSDCSSASPSLLPLFPSLSQNLVAGHCGWTGLWAQILQGHLGFPLASAQLGSPPWVLPDTGTSWVHLLCNRRLGPGGLLVQEVLPSLPPCPFQE